ncbi:hypothetical protein ACJX0J_026338, partial [Zea mays]
MVFFLHRSFSLYVSYIFAFSLIMSAQQGELMRPGLDEKSTRPKGLAQFKFGAFFTF